jgi:hypothetical protein
MTTRQKKARRSGTPFLELSVQCSARTLLSRGRARSASIWGRARAGAATSRGGLLVAAGRERGQAAQDEQCANLLHHLILSENCWRNLLREDIPAPLSTSRGRREQTLAESREAIRNRRCRQNPILRLAAAADNAAGR